MRWTRYLLLLPILALPSLDAGEKKDDPLPPRKIVSMDPRFDQLVPKDAVVETIARGFIWTEGVAWSKERAYVEPRRGLLRIFRRGRVVTEPGFLVFSDIPNNVVHKWQDGQLSGFVRSEDHK